MRLAVVSDIHGNLPALEAVLADAARSGAEAIVNLGDIVSGPLWPAETARRLMALDLPTIAGNHERQLGRDPQRLGWSDAQTLPELDAAQRTWLAALPPTLTLAGGRVLAVHGTPFSDLQYLMETVIPGLGDDGPGIRAATEPELRDRLGTLPPGVEVLLCGHSHVPRVASVEGVLVLNPGSVGLPAYDDTWPHPHHVENGSPHARWALLDERADGWHATLHATPYAHEAAAARAESQGRIDWAAALRSGRVQFTEAQARARRQETNPR